MSRGLVLFLIQVISTVAFFLATIIAARFLGPVEFGDLSTGYSVVSIAYIVCLLGADIAAVGVISIAIKDQRKGLVKAYILFVFIIVIILSVCYYSIAFAGYILAKNILHLKELHPVFVAMIFIPFMALAFFFYRVLISLSRPILANVLFKILINLSMLILAGLMIFDEFYRQTNMAMLLFMLPWFFAFLVMFVLLIHRIRVFDTVSEKIEYKSWFVVGVSALPYNLSLFTIPYIAVIGAEIFLVNESSVGIFATAAFFSQLVANNFSACVQTIALPPIASAVYTKSMSEVRGILNKNIICMGVISVILVIIVLLLGKDILLIYGQKYTAATEDLVVFMVMQGVILSSFLAAPTLLYIGKTKFVAISSLVLILLIVIFMSLFGYAFQEIGLALGILLAVTIVFIAQIAYAYKLTFETSQ